MPLRIQRLNITSYRNYTALRLSPEGARIVVLTGANGAGKTNLLEAVSLLCPGRGLRRAALRDIQSKTDLPTPWAVSAQIETPHDGMARIGTGLSRDSKRRVFRVNNKDAKTQNALAGLLSAIWLTPQMDRLFLEGPAHRRRFFDQLVFSFMPSHITHVNRHQKNLRERMKLLQMQSRADTAWLETLESQMAADAVAIAAARVATLDHLQSGVHALKKQQNLFPTPEMMLTGAAEQQLRERPALEIEETLRQILKDNRRGDAQTGRTQIGAHRCDVSVTDAARHMPAAQCSTGEQKALLISIILSHALMMKAEKGYVPLILLDEIAAHLDDQRRAQLFDFLSAIDGQVWMTGTDEQIFAPLKKMAAFYQIQDGYITASPALAAVS